MADLAKQGAKRAKKDRPLFEDSAWTFDHIKAAYDAIEEIGLGELGLDIYTNQIEVITAEQMLDSYSSIGLPLMYRHWSFGKKFAREELLYRKGAQALAYELVINSDPCINYIMEENTMTMQALVIAHAAFGHNHFFKNNYLFRQWTQADAILDFLSFAKGYINKCEERHGVEAVEALLDAAHALMNYGVNRYDRRRANIPDAHLRAVQRREYEEANYNDLWRTVPGQDRVQISDDPDGEAGRLGLPEENILFFLEQHAPKLEDWQRNILRIVRTLAQYFYPQRLTKMMNEGCATFVHYEIINRLYERGKFSEGAMLEFLHSHSSVIFQPNFNDRRYRGINPYALGFAMMRDIQRIAQDPTPEDRDWFPEIAGCGDAMVLLRDAWANYRDESFVLQFLSPKVMRDFRMFAINDDLEEPVYLVSAIHNDEGYRKVRRTLARHYDLAYQEPEIEVRDADLMGNRRLLLTHTVRNGRLLDKEECDRVLQHVAQLWGYRVKLVERDCEGADVLAEHDALPMP